MDRTSQLRYFGRLNDQSGSVQSRRATMAAARTAACTLLVAVALGSLAQRAVAGEADCRAIESTSGRLACYDAAFPPKVNKPATVVDDTSRGAYKDPFLAEEARTTAKLKNICRGC